MSSLSLETGQMIRAGKVHSGLQDVPATLCSNFVLVN